VGPEVRAIASKANVGLLRAVEQGNVETARKLILEQDADVNALIRWQDGCSPLHHAVQSNNFAMTEMLLQYGADANCPDQVMQFTPLFLAVRIKRSTSSKADRNTALQIAQLLISKGADVNFRDKNGNNASYWANEEGNCEFLDLKGMPKPKTRTAEELFEILQAKKPKEEPKEEKKGKKGKGKKKK